jgi:hypothetical protein
MLGVVNASLEATRSCAVDVITQLGLKLLFSTQSRMRAEYVDFFGISIYEV